MNKVSENGDKVNPAAASACHPLLEHVGPQSQLEIPSPPGKSQLGVNIVIEKIGDFQKELDPVPLVSGDHIQVEIGWYLQNFKRVEVKPGGRGCQQAQKSYAEVGQGKDLKIEIQVVLGQHSQRLIIALVPVIEKGVVQGQG
jgi:hypothetical protein